MVMSPFVKWVLVGVVGSALPQWAAAADKASGDAAQQSKAANSAKPEEAVIYTCPMHPEVTSEKPGRCPKCGMKLERKKPATPGTK